MSFLVFGGDLVLRMPTSAQDPQWALHWRACVSLSSWDDRQLHLWPRLLVGGKSLHILHVPGNLEPIWSLLQRCFLFLLGFLMENWCMSLIRLRDLSEKIVKWVSIREGEKQGKKRWEGGYPRSLSSTKLVGRTVGISSNTVDIKHQFKMTCRLLTNNISQLRRTSEGHKWSSQIP